MRLFKVTVVFIASIIIILSVTEKLYCLVHISLEKFFIKEGNFYVHLSEPQRVVTPFENSIGKVKTYSYQTYIQAFDIFYGVQYTDWRKYNKNLSWEVTPEEKLKDSIDGLRYMWKSRLKTNINLISQKTISYKSFPGKEVELEFFSNKEKYSIKLRLYIIDEQEYLLFSIFPDKFIEMTKYKSFLSSFELK